MGVDMGDYDHDGKPDIFVTELVDQADSLYHQGPDGFTDVSLSSRIAQPSRPYVGWGTGFFDMDNDGWLDTFVANGHVYPQVDTMPNAAHFRQPMLLFRKHRDGTFEEDGTAARVNSIPLQLGRRGDVGKNKKDCRVGRLNFKVRAP